MSEEKGEKINIKDTSLRANSTEYHSDQNFIELAHQLHLKMLCTIFRLVEGKKSERVYGDEDDTVVDCSIAQCVSEWTL